MFCLNRMVPGKLPELDDIRALEALGEFKDSIPDELTRAWLPKLFFFELNEEPIRTQGYYKCHGSILCCKYNAADIVQQTMSTFSSARFSLQDGSDLGDLLLDESDIREGLISEFTEYQATWTQTVKLGEQHQRYIQNFQEILQAINGRC